ncbi:hypothetical protein Taro_030681 [Colocasia esculenta]|uniref:Expansin-like EG45 domain-containing protein n=1 Tax=Colocasia esculenta TaxID=4460 RepID=A0A843VLZ7_COLES|nr:hypothetical protein [Colocasia esculenta]
MAMAMGGKVATLLVVAMTLHGLMVPTLVSAISGTATFYTSYRDLNERHIIAWAWMDGRAASACYGNVGKGVMIAAASDVFWNNGGVCGKRYRVTCTGATNPVPHPCTGKSVEVTIVDHCPGGCAGTIDLSKEAFAIIANPVAGKVQVDYTP